MIKKLLSFDKITKYLNVLLGGILLSIGVAVILAPNHIASGGTPGVAIILNHFSDMQIGLIMFMINIPLVLLSIKFISKGFTLRTIFSICVTSFTVDFIREFLQYEGLILEPIIAAIIGGVFIGFGLGFIIKGDAAAGGPSVVSRLIAQRTKFQEEKIIIILDIIIVISAGFAFEDIEATFLSLISVYISSRFIDIILSGRPSYKMVHISTKKHIEISKEILERFNIRGTVIDALELDLDENKKLLMLIVDSKRILELKNLVEKYDENSFIVVADSYEIMGRGH